MPSVFSECAFKLRMKETLVQDFQAAAIDPSSSSKSSIREGSILNSAFFQSTVQTRFHA